MPLVINALDGGHTDTDTDMQTKAISRNQVCVAFGRTPGLKIFNKQLLGYAFYCENYCLHTYIGLAIM